MMTGTMIMMAFVVKNANIYQSILYNYILDEEDPDDDNDGVAGKNCTFLYKSKNGWGSALKIKNKSTFQNVVYFEMFGYSNFPKFKILKYG